jgi:hypothetical protein
MQIMKQLSIKGLFLPAIALCSLLLSGNAAHAAVVTYSFTGSVSQVNGPLVSMSGPVNMTSGVLGSLQFNNTPSIGNYPGVVTNMTLAIGGYTSSFIPGMNAIKVSNNVDLKGINGNKWKLVTAATGLPLNSYKPFRFNLQLDKEGGMFANTDLQYPPSLASLTGNRWRLIFENTGENLVRVQGALNTLTAVPLPAAVLLFGAGLISLVGLGAGGLRNLRWPQA